MPIRNPAGLRPTRRVRHHLRLPVAISEPRNHPALVIEGSSSVARHPRVSQSSFPFDTSFEEVSMAVRPLRDRILVERVEEQEQRVGGIIIPDTAKEKPQQGRIVAVGRGRVNDKGDVFPLDVKVGDLVLIGKYSGTEIKLDGKEYTILREEEVLGVLEGVAEPALA
jgi:chaperonin GroES